MTTLPEVPHPAKPPVAGPVHRCLVFATGSQVAALDAYPMALVCHGGCGVDLALVCHGGCGVDLALETDDMHPDLVSSGLRWRCRPCDLVYRLGGEIAE